MSHREALAAARRGSRDGRPLDILAAATLLAVTSVTEASYAQEISLTGPLKGACIARRDRYSVPSPLEWDYWVGSGIVVDVARDHATRSTSFLAAGGEITTGIAQYAGFPAPARVRGSGPDARPWRGREYAELRAGPWVQAELRPGGGLVEGGLTFHLGTLDDDLRVLFYTAPYGMLDLRIGGGYGAFPGGRSKEISLSLGWGYRFVFDRGTWGGACDPPPKPSAIADATLLRLALTVRRATDLRAWEGVLAIELTPTWTLVPSRLEQRRFRP